MYAKFGEIEPFDAAAFLDVPFGLAAPDEVADKSGLEQLHAILNGAFPAPTIARTMRQWITAAEPGHSEFRGEPSDDYLNPMGLVHGGWVMTLLDSALGCAVQTTLAAGETYASIGTEVKFVRPLFGSSGQVKAVGRVESRGSRTATASARVHDSAGQLIATGTTTCFIRSVSGVTR